MVISCAAFGCTNRQTKPRSRGFHKFPFSRPELLEKWIRATRRKSWQPTKYSFICSDHFTEDSYKAAHYGLKNNILKRDAVPSLFTFAPKKKNNILKRDNVPSIFTFAPKKKNKKPSETTKIIITDVRSVKSTAVKEERSTVVKEENSTAVKEEKTVLKPFVIYIKAELDKSITDSTNLPNIFIQDRTKANKSITDSTNLIKIERTEL